MALAVGFEQPLALELPEVVQLIGLELAEVERGRELRKALREPLVVIGLPAEHVAPPLVRHLMHSHDVIKLDGLGTVLKMKAVAGYPGESGSVGAKNQRGPSSSQPPRRLPPDS